jgi:hypothetical protein
MTSTECGATGCLRCVVGDRALLAPAELARGSALLFVGYLTTGSYTSTCLCRSAQELHGRLSTTRLGYTTANCDAEEPRGGVTSREREYRTPLGRSDASIVASIDSLGWLARDDPEPCLLATGAPVRSLNRKTCVL